MTIIVIGANGQVGRALRRYLPEATFLTKQQLNISNVAAVRGYKWRGVRVVINAGAYTDVDGAETKAGETEAYLANALGVSNLVDMASHYGFILVHFTSDYRFDGTLGRPYHEVDAANPLSKYGKSKLKGDEYVLALQDGFYLICTSSIYLVGGRNFPAAILRKALAGDELAVVDYQLMRPTYAGDLARAVVRLLRSKAPFGIYNCQNSGPPVTWRQLAEKVLEFGRLKREVKSLGPEEFRARYPNAAPRPDYSVLDLAKLESIGIHMPDWRIPLAEVVPRMLQTLRAQI